MLTTIQVVDMFRFINWLLETENKCFDGRHIIIIPMTISHKYSLLS